MLNRIFFRCFLFLIPCFSMAEQVGVLSLSVGEGYSLLVKKAIENKAEYCNRHGYDFICGYETLDSSRHPAWSKIKLIEKHLPDYDWIFWSDADSLVMNEAIDLESLIDENYMMIVGDTPAGINTGQFLIKNCPEAFACLRACYALEEFINHPWWENQAMIDHLARHPEVANTVKLVPQRVFNSGCKETAGEYANSTDCVYQPGDFIIHFAAARGEFLQNLISDYLQKK